MLCVVGVAVLRVTGGVVPEVGFDAPSFTYAVELQVRPREKKLFIMLPLPHSITLTLPITMSSYALISTLRDIRSLTKLRDEDTNRPPDRLYSSSNLLAVFTPTLRCILSFPSGNLGVNLT